ncbi:MAG TPA: hypothetical protein VHV08_12705, partial [Pirellulales bacterium]|nr:hypothetical protein [Pirellulales bacterium]
RKRLPSDRSNGSNRSRNDRSYGSGFDWARPLADLRSGTVSPPSGSWRCSGGASALTLIANRLNRTRLELRNQLGAKFEIQEHRQADISDQEMEAAPQRREGLVRPRNDLYSNLLRSAVAI